MTEKTTFQISIPADTEGFILLRCDHCGDYFKVTVADAEDERLLNIYCPSCGLISKTYLTPDVIELAQTMAQNYAMDYLHEAFKELERKNKHSLIQFEAGNNPQHEEERPIKAKIESLEISTYICCNRSAKIKPLLKISGGYCPFCGVKNYEIK